MCESGHEKTLLCSHTSHIIISTAVTAAVSIAAATLGSSSFASPLHTSTALCAQICVYSLRLRDDNAASSSASVSSLTHTPLTPSHTCELSSGVRGSNAAMSMPLLQLHNTLAVDAALLADLEHVEPHRRQGRPNGWRDGTPLSAARGRVPPQAAPPQAAPTGDAAPNFRQASEARTPRKRYRPCSTCAEYYQ